jgi:hypothetical protein
MQDNTLIYTTSASRGCLEIRGVVVANSPPCSPDLDLIEHLWWAPRKKPHDFYVHFDYMEDSAKAWEAFKLELHEAWAAIPNSPIAQLVRSMP